MDNKALYSLQYGVFLLGTKPWPAKMPYPVGQGFVPEV